MEDISRRHVIGLGAAAMASIMVPKLARADSYETPTKKSSSYKILSFCGGGIRGLASATMLNYLYQKYPHIISGADLLAGTSTGADIAADLATGTIPQNLINFYLTDSVKFFKHPSTISRLPAYSIDLFAASVFAKYGQMKLSGLNQSVAMTTFNVGDNTTNWFPIVFNNLPQSDNADTLVAEAVVASSSMPGMFGSYKNMVDGAFVNHEPTIAAVALAVNSGVNLDDIVVINFGTGLMGNSLGPVTHHWGAHQWQDGEPSMSSEIYPLLINGKPSPILNISLNGTSANVTPMIANWLLPGRYVNLNPTLDMFIPENDTNPADLQYLQDTALEVDFTPAENLLQKYWS
jgi:predicted acylesterase/phospholipase RssA